MQDTVSKALSRMMASCSRRECCRSEIRAKLERGWGSGSKRNAIGDRGVTAGRSVEHPGLTAGRYVEHPGLAGRSASSLKDRVLSREQPASSLKARGLSAGRSASSLKARGLSAGRSASSLKDRGLTAGRSVSSLKDRGLSAGRSASSLKDRVLSAGRSVSSLKDRGLTAGRSVEHPGLSAGRSVSSSEDRGLTREQPAGARGLSTGQIEEIIERLCREKFIDERRYASAFARDRSSLQGWGPSRIRRALSLKGISPEDITSALDSIDTTAAASRMESLLSAKLRSLRSCDDSQARRVKLLRYGLSRGYSYDQILEFLNSVSDSSRE